MDARNRYLLLEGLIKVHGEPRYDISPIALNDVRFRG
jgi:hypothetical protein